MCLIGVQLFPDGLVWHLCVNVARRMRVGSADGRDGDEYNDASFVLIFKIFAMQGAFSFGIGPLSRVHKSSFRLA